MDTISEEGLPGRRRRRTHSTKFKAQVVAACRAPGVSIAAVAMANGINANLARRWVLDVERRIDGGSHDGVAGNAVAKGFVAAQFPSSETVPADIRIELRRGATVVNLSWPMAAAAECAVWIRALLR
jgi:transposase-like protein